MRVLGCRAYVLTPKEKRLKWEPKARDGLSMDTRKRQMRIGYSTSKGRVMITQDVNFDKSAFGFSPALPEEIVEDTVLDFDSLAIHDRRS